MRAPQGGKWGTTRVKGERRRTGRQAPDGKTRATLTTVAQLTGLSLSTVSLALRGGANLRAETTKRVLSAAAEVGYIPDRAGVRLRTGKSHVLALVLERTNETIDFARFLIQGIGQAIHGTRYHLNVTAEFGSGDSLEAIRYIMTNRTADGVIITHTKSRDPRVELLMDAGFPFVTHGRTKAGSVHPFVDFDSETFVELAVARMAERRRRRVLLVAGPGNTYNVETIVKAFRKATRTAGIEGSFRRPVAGQTTAAQMRELGHEIAAMRPRPDGIICDNELNAIFIIAGLTDSGLTLDDVGFICKQTSNILPALHPGIDTIEEDVLDAGRHLADILIRAVSGETASSLGLLTEPRPHWRG